MRGSYINRNHIRERLAVKLCAEFPNYVRKICRGESILGELSREERRGVRNLYPTCALKDSRGGMDF